MIVKKDERLKETFCDLATQYYVAARFGAQAGLLPVHGNLFHHAVEMYLKAALVATLPVGQMKKKYRHDLTALWDQFKTKEADPVLSRFDPAIQALHKFESIRYPDEIVDKGMLASIAWQPHHAVTGTGSAKVPPKYEVIIADIDDLVIEVLQRASVNQKFLITRVHHAYAREALAYQNPQAGRWL
ncbi:MAG: hypothetical protein AB1898_28445 [Acidobacteriota bacterium]